MQTLKPAKPKLDNVERKAKAIGVTPAWYVAQMEGDWFMNDQYTVIVLDLGDGSVHLSIRRNDRKPVRDWRDLQEIKNQLLGPECEAVELFPAESRLVDSANQFHLWGVRDPTYRFPLGWQTERIVIDDPAIDAMLGSKQRPFAKEGSE